MNRHLPLRSVPPTEQLGSLRKVDHDPGSEPFVEHGPDVSLVPESHPVYVSMPRDPSTGDDTKRCTLDGASSTVGQDPNPAGTGANDAPGTVTTTGTVAESWGKPRSKRLGLSHLIRCVFCLSSMCGCT